MISLNSLLTTLLVALTFILPGCAAESENKWALVWSDNFDGSELDSAKWKAEVSCWGGGNNERQCYTDRPDNIKVADGLLHLKAKKETFRANEFPEAHPEFPGEQVEKAYTSGKVRTLDLAEWKYGRFEARMKLPSGQGTWPAFWMLPANNVYGPWAASGEIDIMEAVNLGESCAECQGNVGENRSSGALHYGGEWPDNTFQVKHNRLQGGTNAKDQYHVFAVEWGEGHINWFVDNEKFFTLTADQWHSGNVNKDAHPYAPFDQDFYLMLNLAVGGGLSEDNNSKGFNPKNFPAEILIDWVHVYQCKTDIETSKTCMNTKPL